MGVQMSIQISALVVAHNEATQLTACLERLRFADEIVVLLDRCQDASAAIASNFGAKVVEGAWPLEGERRMAAIAACAGRWILEVDADERVSTELAYEIRRIVEKPHSEHKGDWYRVPFDNFIGTRLVRYGWGASFGVSAKACLFRAGCKEWGNQRVHPKVKLHGACAGVLQNRIEHYVDRDITDLLHRLNRYTTAHALDLRDSGDIGTLRRNVLRIFGRFWKCYVRRHGYREGGLGLLLAICAGLYPFLSYLKARYDLAPLPVTTHMP